MNRGRKKLEGSRKRKGRNSSVHCDCKHRAKNDFAIRIRKWLILAGTSSKTRGDDGERVHVFEGYGGGFPVDGDAGGALKAACREWFSFVPPDTEAVSGEIVPMPSGTLAN